MAEIQCTEIHKYRNWSQIQLKTEDFLEKVETSELRTQRQLLI